MSQTINFSAINAAALANFASMVSRWLPGGKFAGHEYSVRNPKRDDRAEGSFRINIRTGHWADFATDDRGGDPISLAAYLHNLSQPEAAQKLAHMLGLEASK